MDPATLIDRYCQVWSEPDAAVRAELLASVWSPGATYTDPTVHAEGAQELLAHIAKVQARRPGAAVVRTSEVDIHHGLARFAWHVVQADGTALPESLDIAFIAPDGARIERIIGYFGPLAGRAK
ncbi:MAG: nuclear transport factor 2 family protein [Ramlibacter sp.]|nr:nuclear transport factor 2 family protein [Ramlibacter sp.]